MQSGSKSVQITAEHQGLLIHKSTGNTCDSFTFFNSGKENRFNTPNRVRTESLATVVRDGFEAVKCRRFTMGFLGSDGWKLNIRNKLILATVALGTFAVGLVAFIGYRQSANALRNQAFAQLSSVRSALQQNIESYFTQARFDLATHAESLTVRNALRDLSAARKSLLKELEMAGQPVDGTLMRHVTEENRKYYEDVLISNLSQVRDGSPGTADDFLHPDPEVNILQYVYTVKNTAAVGNKEENSDTSDIVSNPNIPPEFRSALGETSYVKSHSIYHPILKQLVSRFGYYDVFVCDAEGYVVYSVFKELDFNGNLRTGPQKDTGIGQAFALGWASEKDGTLAGHVKQTDFAPYSISYDAPATFLGCPIYGADGKKEGVMIYQLPVDRINEVMTMSGKQEEVGLGASGESYLVGPDFKHRTDSRFMDDLEDGSGKRKVISADGQVISYTSIGVLRVDTEGTRRIFSSDAGKRVGVDVYPDYRGVAVLGSYGPLNIPGLPLGILTEIDAEEAFLAAGQQATTALWVGIGTLVLFVVLAFFLARQISQPIDSLVQTANAVAAGDDSARAVVTTRDEIGELATQFNAMVGARVAAQQKIEEENKNLQANIRDLLMVVSDASDGDFTVRAEVTEGALGNVADALNLMFETVGELIQGVQAAAARVASSSTEIQVASDQLAQGAQKQAEEVINTTAAVQEMSSNIESVANNAGVAAEAGQRTKDASEVGNEAVVRVVDGMNRVRENVLAGAKKIKRLGDRSMEISTIVNTIEEISAQTDMLALNAAIEAARAGEHGRGFSVVAEEVRKLAERAANATREIEKLIAGIQAETNEAVVSMEEQTSRVEEESRVVTGAGESLTNIRNATVQASELINEISLSAKQQVRGANGVVEAMEVVAEIAKQAQSGADQTKRSTEELASLAGELTSSVGQFKV